MRSRNGPQLGPKPAATAPTSTSPQAPAGHRARRGRRRGLADTVGASSCGEAGDERPDGGRPSYRVRLHASERVDSAALHIDLSGRGSLALTASDDVATRYLFALLAPFPAQPGM